MYPFRAHNVCGRALRDNPSSVICCANATFPEGKGLRLHATNEQPTDGRSVGRLFRL